MAQTKKKSKAPARKQSGRAAKKSVKAKAKKKTTAATKKKTKSPARKKAVKPVARKARRSVKKTARARKPEMKSVPQQVKVPEVIKQHEEMPPDTVNNEMQPDIVEKNKMLEHQFENRSEVIMNQENQRVKSAMANRQGTKRVFHTQRHS